MATPHRPRRSPDHRHDRSSGSLLKRSMAPCVTRRDALGLIAAATAAGVTGPAAASTGALRRVATLADLSQPWAAVAFTAQDGAEEVPGILVALPGGAIYAAALLCTHGGCPLQYETSAQTISDTYDVTVPGAALVCPCHFSVFDLTRDGAVAGGPAPRPPWRFEVMVRDGDVLVGRLDRS